MGTHRREVGPVRRMPTLILFCGLPGSGKTTLAKELEAQGRGVRLCTDEWQAALQIEPTDGEFHERLQAFLYEHALALLVAGTDVILEDGLWMRHERAQKFADARRCGAWIEWHVFDLDHHVLWSRLQRRNAAAEAGACPMTEAELRWAEGLFEPPTEAELQSVDHVTVHRGTTAAAGRGPGPGSSPY